MARESHGSHAPEDERTCYDDRAMAERLTGHVRHLGGDSWQLVVNLPAEVRIAGDGSLQRVYPRRYRQVSANGVRRARQALATFIAEVERQGAVDVDRLTVADLLQRWLDLEVASQLRPKTAERYRQLVCGHLMPGLGRVRVLDFDPADWLAFHAHCRENGRLDGRGGLSEQTCAHLFRALHRAFEWAIEAGLIERNPLRRVGRHARPSPPQRRQATWSIAQVLDAIALAKPTMLYIPAMLAGLAGMRRGEICGLTWRDVDFHQQLLVVRTSVEQTAAGLHDLTPKTKSGERTVLLPTLVVEALREHKREQHEMRLAAGGRWNRAGRVVCRSDGSPMPPNAVSSRWSEWVRRKKLEPYISFHGLRHSYATGLYELGVRTKTVQQRLGHSTPAVTRSLYLHGTDEADLAALAAQEQALAEAKARQDSRLIRDSVSELSEARSRKSC